MKPLFLSRMGEGPGHDTLFVKRSSLKVSDVSLWCLGVACLGIGVSVPDVTEAAFRKNASVTLEAEHNSNVSLTDVENSNRAYRLGGQFQLAQESARFNTDINLSVSREFNSDRDDRTLPVGALNSRWTISRKRLFWVLNDTVSVVLRDPLSASTVEESETTNTLSTGPDWVIPFTPFTSLRFSGRYERVDYENEAQADRPRENASVTLNHVINSSWSTDLSHSVIWEEFEQADSKRSTNQIGLSFTGKRINWRAAVGETELDGGNADTDVASFNFRYRVSSVVSLVGAYSESLDSDIGRATRFAQQRSGEFQFLADECRDSLGGGSGNCEDLPGVSVVAEEEIQTYRNDRDQRFLDTGTLAQSYDFQTDNALFETEDYSLGLQIALKRMQISLDYIESEERQSIDISTGGVIAEPDVISRETSRVTFRIPLTARLRSTAAYELRKPETRTLGRTSALEEELVTLGLNWSVEPMLSAFVKVIQTNVLEDADINDALIAQQEADGERYVIGFQYNFQ